MEIPVPVRLRQQQQELAAHLRNPACSPPPPGIEERRLAVYRELFFNNIRSLLGGMFPVIRSLYTETDWSALVRDFYEHHRCHTPYFPEIAAEFVAWLQEMSSLPEDKPFLQELAHYEWVELALGTSEETLVQMPIHSPDDVLTGVPLVSPLCWALVYRFPVHRIGVDCQPATVPDVPTCLLVYRNSEDKVCFVESNPASIRLIEILQKNHMQPSTMASTGEQVLNALALELQHPTPHTVLQFGRELLLTWYQLGIIPAVLSRK